MSDELVSLLQFIIDVCGTGNSVVFSAEDFFAERKEETRDESALSRALYELDDAGYVSVKYACGGMYCVRLLLRGREYVSKEREHVFEILFERTRCRNAAFFGGLFGGLAGGLFFFLLSLCLR